MNQDLKNISISVSTGSIIRGSLFVVLLIFLYYIRDIVLVILAAVVIASAIEPLTKCGTAFARNTPPKKYETR